MSTANVYHIRYPVPVTRGDGFAWLYATPGLPVSLLIERAVDNFVKLSAHCPAGGIVATPLDGEQWAFKADDVLVTGNDLMPGAPTDFDLVLIDKYGEQYDAAELMRTRSA